MRFFVNYVYTLSKLVIYTFTFRYSLTSRTFKSQIFCGMHRISYGLKILFFPIQHSVHSLFLRGERVRGGGGGGGGWSSYPIFKKGHGLTGPHFLEGGCWERVGVFFQGGLQFLHQKKLKSDIFDDKKDYKRKFFSLS